MKKQMFLVGLSAFILAGCSSNDDELLGNWKERSDFEGLPRCAAVAFTVGNYGYVGTGSDGAKERYKDLWRFDPNNGEKGQWTQMADMPAEAIARSHATAFATNTAGYVGFGVPEGYQGSSSEFLNDFWQYDVANNSWSAIADFPLGGRYGALGFSANNRGYVGAGDDGNILKDLWEYDPTTDSWAQRTSIPGSKRRGASVFVFNDLAYICCGWSSGATNYPYDFYVYDASDDTWQQKRNIADTSDESYDDDYRITRSEAAAFTVGSRGYISTGTSSGTNLSTTWEYDPENDLWEEKTGYESTSRTEAVGLSINGRGYVLTGRSSSNVFDDMMEFFPFDEQVDYD